VLASLLACVTILPLVSEGVVPHVYALQALSICELLPVEMVVMAMQAIIY